MPTVVNAAKMIDELQKILELNGNFQTLCDLTKHVCRTHRDMCLILGALVAGLNGKPLHFCVSTFNYIILDAADGLFLLEYVSHCCISLSFSLAHL